MDLLGEGDVFLDLCKNRVPLLGFRVFAKIVYLSQIAGVQSLEKGWGYKKLKFILRNDDFLRNFTYVNFERISDLFEGYFETFDFLLRYMRLLIYIFWCLKDKL